MKDHSQKSSSNYKASSHFSKNLKPSFKTLNQIVDNRKENIVQKKLIALANASSQIKQMKHWQTLADAHSQNTTGLPGNLKTGIENLSGYSMDDVKVHRNSEKPAQFQAHAFTQGSDIHVAPGQEKHLPHEAWHVVQQKQGRVQPTRQFKNKVLINDDTHLETEADVMGQRALQHSSGDDATKPPHSKNKNLSTKNPIQRTIVLNDSKKTKISKTTQEKERDEFLKTHFQGSLEAYLELEKFIDDDKEFPIETVDKLITEKFNEISKNKNAERGKQEIWKEVTGQLGKRIQDQDWQRHGPIVGKYGKERLQRWLKESPLLKEQTGTGKQKTLMVFLIKDLEGYKQQASQGNFKGHEQDIIDQLSNTLPAFFMNMGHNASHQAVQGMGMSNQAETENPLFYYRSQAIHPHERFYTSALKYLRKLIDENGLSYELGNTGSKEKINTSKVIVPSNPVIAKLIHDTLGSNIPKTSFAEKNVLVSDSSQLQAPAQNIGSLHTTQTGQYSGPVAARAGLRVSNPIAYSHIIKLMLTPFKNDLAKGMQKLIDFVKMYFFADNLDLAASNPFTGPKLSNAENHYQNMKKVSASYLEDPMRYAKFMLEELKKLPDKLLKSLDDKDVQVKTTHVAETLDYKSSFSYHLTKILGKANFKYFHVFNQFGNPNLVIQLSTPPFTKGYVLGGNSHTAGWVNTVLGYLGGLLNYYSAKSGMNIHVNRRQSFGFLRPSLTDTGESIRLSMGVQPLEFGEVILYALMNLDIDIGTLKKSSAQNALKVVERSSGGKIADRMANAMRTETVQLGSFNEARKYAPNNFSGYIDFIQNKATNQPASNPDEFFDNTIDQENIKSNYHGKVNEEAAKMVEAFKKSTQKDLNLQNNIIRKTLARTLAAVGMIISSYDDWQNFVYLSAYARIMQQVINQTQKGLALLDSKLVGAEFYNKATLVIESLTENLPLLKMAANLKNEPEDPEKEIEEELAANLKIDQSLVNVYRADSGEQAAVAGITLSMLEAKTAMAQTQHSPQAGQLGSYFELEDFINKDSKFGKSGNVEVTSLVDPHPGTEKSSNKGVLDEGSNLIIEKLKTVASLNQLKHYNYTIVVDMTNSDLGSKTVQDALQVWQNLRSKNKDAEQRLRLVLASSLIKHEQFGADKIQAGRIIVLGPNFPGKHLQNLHESTSHPLMLEFLNIVHMISEESFFKE